jgi:hypothetical protein
MPPIVRRAPDSLRKNTLRIAGERAQRIGPNRKPGLLIDHPVYGDTTHIVWHELDVRPRRESGS